MAGQHRVQPKERMQCDEGVEGRHPPVAAVQQGHLGHGGEDVQLSSLTLVQLCRLVCAVVECVSSRVDCLSCSTQPPTDGCGAVEPPLQPDAAPPLYNVLSSHEYEWVCTDGGGQRVPARNPVANVHVPIEPLAGPLRSPRICDALVSEVVLSRKYLVFDRWAASSANSLRRMTADGQVAHVLVESSFTFYAHGPCSRC